ncbi:hypothetical protein [Mycobacteroides abscessus]|uniref:hypothetical protein n=1 Tax=Mycobacteroides abscessus TaxID=36809 RepID=UPI000241BAF4|nr:hypothetical protein [Mycobacteroides abscessus]EHM15223.1 hypothetical protein MMAS_36030 [Mycobacteroides abscessus subsp. massiliense CCUG 48898 = JCM 15300]EIV64847.1 hypothetical protein MMCCUG48898_3760 [Mycobacteroides abscessus subsp. massiliense CCUG 48898 = JCM 15300]ORA88779.1 hypothetical protein BST32_15800 [Mycobacteroides abscessus subsp. massiliense]BAP98516.1 hypothetical protein MMASJCM_3740 [Mycobacteroides abscessus subsp. massiliense CCUG 48898 = JCM 15300]
MYETELEGETPDEHEPLWRRARSVDDDREAAFQRYPESSVPYFDAVDAAGHTPWHHGDIELRRKLFYRRYIRSNDRVVV